MTWSELGEWWISEIADDPAYEQVVTPLLLDLLQPERGLTYLDLGAGEGRVMREVISTGAYAHGIDLNPDLARLASKVGPVVVGDLPELGFIRDDSYDGCYCVLVLEHIEDHTTLFGELARVVRPGGVMALVMNHPAWTSPGSTPITDFDGEILWRPGAYFEPGTTLERAGDNTVTFHHRSLADLLTTSAERGWSLQRIVETPHHEYIEQARIPRLLACRWRLLP